MKPKRPALTTFITAAVCGVLLFHATTTAQVQERKADPSGTWTWSQPLRSEAGNGSPTVNTLQLKADGETLTGTLSTPRRGGEIREVAIKNGKVKGDEISFSVTGKFALMTIVVKFSGKVSNDFITGKIDARVFGQKASQDWQAKRATNKMPEAPDP